MHAAQRPQRGDHVLGHLPLVEARAPLRHDAPQHLRLARRAKDRARHRRAPVHEVMPAPGPGEVARLGPVVRDAGCDRHARLEIGDQRGERVGQPQPPHLRRQGAVPVHRAGHRHRMGGMHRHRLMAFRAQGGGIGGGGRAARGVEPPHLPVTGHQREHVAAQSRHLRLAQAQQHRPRDGRVHRVASAPERVHRHPRRQRVRCRAHAVGGKDSGTAGQVKIAHGTLADRSCAETCHSRCRCQIMWAE